MSATQVHMRKVMDAIDERPLRERALLFIAFIGVLYMLASLFVFGPMAAEQKRLQKQMDSTRTQTHAFNAQIEAMAGQGGADSVEVTTLRARLAALDAQVADMTHGFVSPTDMPKLLEKMLKENRGLKLVKMENLPPVPMEAGGAATGIYKHGLRMEFRGRYPDIVRYLRALEALPWKMFWGEVSLSVDKYPRSTVTIVLYTLSPSSSWIGV